MTVLTAYPDGRVAAGAVRPIRPLSLPVIAQAGGPSISPKHADFGAKGDLRFVLDGVGNGTTTYTSATANFKAGRDEGKSFDTFAALPGVGNTTVTGTIVSVQSATTVTLSIVVPVATNLAFYWGTDDAVALQNWINGTGPGSPYAGQRTLDAGGYYCGSALTAPANSAVTIDGPGAIFFASTLGAGNGLSWADTAGQVNSYFRRVSFVSSAGHTGRQLSLVCTPENQDIKTFWGCSFVHSSLTHDYMVFGDGAQPYLDTCFFACGAGSPGAKMLAVNCPGSLTQVVNSELIGRAFFNVQALMAAGCALGPQRLGNNSKRDNSGTAQQTNTYTYIACYCYDAGLALGDFRNFASVVVSAAGEGAEGGAFPNLNFQGCYIVCGGMSTAAQITISGNLTVAQGAVSISFTGTTWIQAAGSGATSMTLVQITGGNGLVDWGAACAANILGTVTTAIMGTRSAGNAEFRCQDPLPSGVATIWQHPTTSPNTAALTNLPTSGNWSRNMLGASYEVVISSGVATLTKIDLSPDNGTTILPVMSDAAAIAHITNTHRYPPGAYARYTYAGGTPQYTLTPN